MPNRELPKEPIFTRIHLVSGRAREAALMVGFPIAGPVFAISSLSLDIAWRIVAFACAMFLLFLSLYDFNDYCGHRADALNPRLQPLKKAPRNVYLTRTAITLGGAVLVFGLLKPVLALGAVTSFILWGIYSWPKKGWKEVPVLGTAIHFVTQTLHFLMGWSLVADVNSSGMLIAFFFGGLFSSGHLFHEVIDFEADRSAGVMTMANRIGRRPAFWISTGAFAACLAYWTFLFDRGRIDAAAFAPFFVAFLVHAAALAFFASTGRTEQRAGIIQLRGIYRMCYLLGGLGYLAQKLV